MAMCTISGVTYVNGTSSGVIADGSGEQLYKGQPKYEVYCSTPPFSKHVTSVSSHISDEHPHHCRHHLRAHMRVSVCRSLSIVCVCDHSYPPDTLTAAAVAHTVAHGTYRRRQISTRASMSRWMSSARCWVKTHSSSSIQTQATPSWEQIASCSTEIR